MLIILAGITLNAVIGENGIIFQAKDTKNMITNETQYDNAQLAQLQNELKDNHLYSGIGIIPGTDTGGSSEGGENGTINKNDTPGQNNGGTSGTNNDFGNNGGHIPGTPVQPPRVEVIEGEEIAASVYRSNITIQIKAAEGTQIKYILSTTVSEINNELYPSGLIRELDIENGGTLTFIKDGEYTITAYAYDGYGNKSTGTSLWVKKVTSDFSESGVEVSVSQGQKNENSQWYISNVTLRVLGTDKGSTKVTYRVRGTATTNGKIGEKEYQVGAIDTGEVEIANGTTFKIEADGEFFVTAYTYDAGNRLLSSSNALSIKRDISRPIIKQYTGEQKVGTGFEVKVLAEDETSGLAQNERYVYRHKKASDTNYEEKPSQEATCMYKGLEANRSYDIYVIVKDEAGNMVASKIISKPALWVSNGTTAKVNEEGSRSYYNSNIEVSVIGQEKENAEINKVTYQIIGTTTGDGAVDGVFYNRGTALAEDEKEIETVTSTKKIVIQADGNWTIKVHTYNQENIKVTTNTLEVTRDTVRPNAPEIAIVSGTQGEVGYYSTDIGIKLTSQDDTSYLKTTYTVTGTAVTSGKIGNINVSAGQSVSITETEITNGGTFLIQADGTWTVKGYTYDKTGNKSPEMTGITVIRDTINPTANQPSITQGTAGQAGFYRGDIKVRIAGSDHNILRIAYKITGTAKGSGMVGTQNVTNNQSVNIAETTIGNNGEISITADGTWTITTVVYDRAGRKSSSSLTFTRDTAIPGTPGVNLNGIAGDNGWYRSNVTVSITNGSDSFGEISRSTYTITGAQNVGETAGNSVTITAEGTSTITAYTYDKAGNRSAPKTVTVKKDSVGPVITGLSNITVTSYNANTFTNGVSVSDATSGMNGTYDYNPKTLTSGNNTITYTAKDKAGNTTSVQRIITYNWAICFVAGTKVSTPEGLKNIEELKVGDYVQTYNEETQEIEVKPITKTHINPAKEITKITFANGEEIENTKAHPYYVIGKGWKETKDLEIGDKILTEEKEEIEIVEIKSEEREITVYNLTIQDNHNYFVGTSRLLVHNSGAGGCGLEEYPIE